MTDFHKSFRQNMHRKTADKLLVAQNHLLFDAFLAVIFVRKSDRLRINFSDSLVADCDFVGITTQIFHHRFWASKRLFSENYPRFFPQISPDFGIFFKVLSFSFSQNLALKTLLTAFTGNKNLPSFLMFFQVPLSSTPPPGTMQCKCG